MHACATAPRGRCTRRRRGAAALRAAALPQVFVNDQPVQIPKGFSVLQACDAAGIDIPR